MDAATLQSAINEVCPVVSVTVGDEADRVTWQYIPAPEATQAQTLSADTVIATIPTYPAIAVTTADFIARWTNAEYRALQDRRVSDNGKTGKDFDIVTGGGTINFNRKRTKSFAADCVTAGILTQARADEIFS